MLDFIIDYRRCVCVYMCVLEHDNQPNRATFTYNILYNLYLVVISKHCFLCLNILTSLTDQHWSAFEETLSIFQPIADRAGVQITFFVLFVEASATEIHKYITFKMNLHTKMLPVKSATFREWDIVSETVSEKATPSLSE